MSALDYTRMDAVRPLVELWTNRPGTIIAPIRSAVLHQGQTIKCVGTHNIPDGMFHRSGP